jgi:FecR protein
VALSASAVLADQQIGNVVQKDFNGAKGLRVASTSADDLLFNHDVFAGEIVKTSASASTVIRFQDQTQIQVGANSSIVLDKFVYDPASGTGDAAIKFGTGVFRFITGDIKNKDAVKLTTPTTSLTIRARNLSSRLPPTARPPWVCWKAWSRSPPAAAASRSTRTSARPSRLSRTANPTPSRWGA